jgi:hypothetical protein
MMSEKHDVWIDEACLHLKKGGVTIKINKGKIRIGTLKVTNTRIFWMSKNQQPDKGMKWSEFDSLMLEANKKERN